MGDYPADDPRSSQFPAFGNQLKLNTEKYFAWLKESIENGTYPNEPDRPSRPFDWITVHELPNYFFGGMYEKVHEPWHIAKLRELMEKSKSEKVVVLVMGDDIRRWWDPVFAKLQDQDPAAALRLKYKEVFEALQKPLIEAGAPIRRAAEEMEKIAKAFHSANQKVNYLERFEPKYKDRHGRESYRGYMSKKRKH